MNPMLNMFNLLDQIKQNPLKLLSQRFNLPDNLPKDPQSILDHLVSTGQVSQEEINQVMQMRQMFSK